MSEITSVPQHQPVTWLKVFLEESRLLLVRYWWLLLGHTLILVTLVYWRLPQFISDYRHGVHEWYLDLNHTYIWPIFLHPVKLFMLVTAAAWALLIWGNRSPEHRSSSWTMPVSRLTHHTARILPGAVLLLITYLITWYAGVIVSSTFAEVRGLVAGFLPSMPFFALGLSLLNLYLLSSIICLRFQQPYRWLFLYFPVVTLIIFGVRLLLDMPAVNLLFSPLLPPHGLLGGLGVSLWDRMGDTVGPVIWVPFLWFGIIVVSLWFTASRHQEA